ncbi:MAG TPA: glycosyltransferase [Desulfobulbaceae bacterium]|nr:glycosyltransferase [Desulfobulbaceae bacterium]
MGDQLILFTRYPEPGRVKTRLIPALGEQGAADLHRKLTDTCLGCLLDICKDTDTGITVFFSGGNKQQMYRWLPDMSMVRQEGADLGERMIAAFSHVRAKGGQHILLVGSDCPELSPAIIRQGFQYLLTHDLVLGTAHDGGYYLVGISADFAPASLEPLMIDMEWGTGDVLSMTLARIRRAGYSCGLLPRLHDIDRPEDLAYFEIVHQG